MAAEENIVQINIEEEMKTAYIDYSMSVIVSRALPDVRDGLKPVQRRVLYSMNDLGLSPGKPYKKSARIVGECFVAGTLVQTPKGVVPIEQLQIGDKVYTQSAIRKVTQLYVMPEQPLWEVRVQNNLIKKEYKNICTAGQLFKVLTPDMVMVWKKASALQLGDALVCKPSDSFKMAPYTSTFRQDKAIHQHNAKTISHLKVRLQTNQLPFNVPYEYLTQWAQQGIEFYPVSHVQPTTAGITYDIQVETDHEFIANGMLVHNCLGKYHPHGDSSVYEAMVRMAQTWSLRYPAVDGQGNFGSMDGDSPAAMRYTEARLRRVSSDMMVDIEKETVDFQLNFDDSLEEPKVLPTRIPNLLINGASGIAVGMATNMLPHNLNEVVSGIMAYIDNPDIEIKELTEHIKAPDFPTGGTIYGRSGVHKAFLTGRGRVVVRGKTDIEHFGNNRERIIATEIPYQVNKATLIKRTADLVNEKKIEGISAIRDESDRRGLRIVYELKKDANANVVLNQLYNSTALQSSYGVNNICLVNGRPRLLNVKQLIEYFVEFRHEVVVRRTQYELRKAEERAHLLIGLLKALDHIDAIIKLIRASKNAEEAKQELIATFDFSDRQAKAILDMRLHRLTALERDKLQASHDELMSRIAHYQAILASKPMRMDIIKEELVEIQAKYGDNRRTDIVENEDEITIEDIIDNEQVVVTISHRGYIKRTSLDEYREQNRGGKGSRASQTRDEDFIEHLFTGSTHNYLLIFTEQGKCHWLRMFRIPEGGKTTKGRAIQNLLNLPKEDVIKAYLPIRSENFRDPDFLANHYVIFCTKQGVIKKTALESFARPRKGGIVALGIREGDTLLEAKLTNGNCDVLLGSRYGRAVRFSEDNVREMGRTATGVRGITLHDNGRDEVVGMVTIQRGMQEAEDVQILSISEKGYGKRTALEEYRLINRGGKGVKSINVTEKTGGLIAIKDVITGNGLMIINKSGIAIRMSVDNISLQGRATQGVRLINLSGDDEIASVAKIVLREEEEEAENEGNNEHEDENGDNTSELKNQNEEEGKNEPEE